MAAHTPPSGAPGAKRASRSCTSAPRSTIENDFIRRAKNRARPLCCPTWDVLDDVRRQQRQPQAVRLSDPINPSRSL